jgi:hypothetical protein
MHEPKILHRLAVLHGAIRACQPLESMEPDRRAQLLQSARELTGTKYRSLRAALSGLEKKSLPSGLDAEHDRLEATNHWRKRTSRTLAKIVDQSAKHWSGANHE